VQPLPLFDSTGRRFRQHVDRHRPLQLRVFGPVDDAVSLRVQVFDDAVLVERLILPAKPTGHGRLGVENRRFPRCQFCPQALEVNDYLLDMLVALGRILGHGLANDKVEFRWHANA